MAGGEVSIVTAEDAANVAEASRERLLSVVCGQPETGKECPCNLNPLAPGFV